MPDVLDGTHTSFVDVWPETAADVRFAGNDPIINAARRAFEARDDFSRGVRGIYRPKRSYLYVTERSQSAPEVDLAKDGTFTLTMFGARELPIPCGDRWSLRQLRTRHSAAGFVAESRDGLNIPSATLFANGGSLQIAAATNATRDEIAHESFEFFDARALITPLQTGDGNITFTTAGLSGIQVTDARAHTGRRSLRVSQDTALQQTTLQLVPGKRYVLSAWQAIEPRGRPLAPPEIAGVRVDFTSKRTGAVISSQLHTASGPIIEGWQRIDGTIDVPNQAADLILWLVNSGGGRRNSQTLYIDDLRILPEDAGFESYVYESSTLRLVATLDENNFATLFAYAPDGKVNSIRRETVRGVLTVAESRLHVKERRP